MTNKDQYTEIRDITWLSEEECYQKIRNYDNNKKKIISDFFKLYKSIYIDKELLIKD